MIFARCDECGAEKTVPATYARYADGWLTVTRDWMDSEEQYWAFCSAKCASTWLGRGRLPRRQRFARSS